MPSDDNKPKRLLLPGEEEALEFLAEAQADEFKPEEQRRGFTITKWAEGDPVKAANLADYLISIYGQGDEAAARVKEIAAARRADVDTFERQALARVAAEQAWIEMVLKVYADETFPQRERTIKLISGKLERKKGWEKLALVGTEEEIMAWLLAHDSDGGYDLCVEMRPKLKVVEFKKLLDWKGGAVVYKPTGEYLVVEEKGAGGEIAVEKKLAVVETVMESFLVKPLKRGLGAHKEEEDGRTETE